MPLDSRIHQLLSEWEQGRAAGRAVSAEELCRDCPDLADECRRQIDLLQAAEDLLDRDRSTLPSAFARRDSGAYMQVEAIRVAEAAGSGKLGHFPVLALLGQGGMGTVLRVHDPVLNRSLALKVLRPEYQHEADFVRRFLEEAQIAGQLQHPGLAPIHELGRLPDGRPYYTMKLIEGRTLADLLRERPSVDQTNLPRFVNIFQQVCQTLAFAHARRIIHRDLKPANIMVGAFGEVQLMDWGLAKALPRESTATAETDTDVTSPGAATSLADPAGDQAPQAPQATQAGWVLGTVAYMPPEQARGEIDRIGKHSDVFGLGAILCEILTRRPPYQGALSQVLADAKAGNLQPAFERMDGSGQEAELVALAKRCLAARAEERPRDAGAVATAVERYLDGVQERLRTAELERAQAEVKAAEEKKRRLVERQKRRLTLVLAAAFLILVLGSFWIWQQAQAQEEKLARDADKLLHDGETDERLAQAELEAGRRQSALKILKSTAERLPDEPAFVNLHAAVQARHDRVKRVVDFDRLSTEAELAIAEKYPSISGDEEALAKCAAALDSLGVFQHRDWWKHLPDIDLPEAQRLQLHKEVYRQLHIHGALQIKGGVTDFFGFAPAGPAVFKKALLSMELVQRFQPSYSASLAEMFCHFKLNDLKKIKWLKGRRPENATDIFFVGLIHTWFDPDGQGAMNAIFKKAGTEMGLDLTTRMVTAESYLRLAASLEPAQYWNNFWLGVTLSRNGKLEEAELVFNNCVAHRPEYKPVYLERDSVLCKLYRRSAHEAQRQAILKSRLAAFENGLRHNASFAEYPEYFYRRGQARLTNGDRDAGLSDLGQAIALHESLATEQAKIEPLRIGYLCGYHADCFSIAQREQEAAAVLRRGAKLVDRAASAKTDDPVWLNRRANAYADLGQWNKAAADFEKRLALMRKDLLIQFGVKKEDLAAWFSHALACLGAEDLARYRAVCGSMRKALSEADQLTWAGWTMLLGLPAASPADIERALRLGEAGWRKDSSKLTYLVTHGAALYRAGKLADAVARLTAADAAWQKQANASQTASHMWHTPAITWFLLALAEGDEPAKAGPWLRKAVERMEREMADADAVAPFPWPRRLAMQLLRREAEQRLKQ